MSFLQANLENMAEVSFFSDTVGITMFPAAEWEPKAMKVSGLWKGPIEASVPTKLTFNDLDYIKQNISHGAREISTFMPRTPDAVKTLLVQSAESHFPARWWWLFLYSEENSTASSMLAASPRLCAPSKRLASAQLAPTCGRSRNWTWAFVSVLGKTCVLGYFNQDSSTQDSLIRRYTTLLG